MMMLILVIILGHDGRLRGLRDGLDAARRPLPEGEAAPRIVEYIHIEQ